MSFKGRYRIAVKLKKGKDSFGIESQKGTRIDEADFSYEIGVTVVANTDGGSRTLYTSSATGMVTICDTCESLPFYCIVRYYNVVLLYSDEFHFKLQ